MTPLRPRVVAVIPARGGSMGLPGKNLRALGGVPLVARAIRAAAAARCVDEVHVSSDCPEILAVARAWGAGAIRRPDGLAGPEASSESALLHALGALEATGPVSVLLFLQCTSPFTTAADVEAVAAPVLAGDCDSAFAAAPHHGFLWRAGPDGEAIGVNHDHRAPRRRRQDLAPEFVETGAVYAMRAAVFRAEGGRFCGRVRAAPLPRARIEIDDASDWRRAEALLPVEAPSAGVDPRRLAAVRAVAMDFDGVHTDGGALIDENGRESVRCDRRDGQGVAALRAAGLATLILSAERNPVVARRAAKLGVEAIHPVEDKAAVLDRWLEARGLAWEATAYVGDDVADLGCMARAGVSFAPCDARPEVLAAADIVLPRPGGRGAVRDMADMLLATRTRT